MNFWLNLALETRYGILAVVGALLGAAINLVAYALAYERRPISPWLALRVDGQLRLRSPLARLPIAGWLTLRGESELFGPRHWWRPLIVEILMAAALPLLYWWEVASAGLWMPFPMPQGMPLGAWFVGEADLNLSLHAMFATHVLLATAMLAASLIDIDEKLIPDGVTVPGTLLGLATAAIYPWSRLPAGLAHDRQGDLVVDFLKVTSPIREPWPELLAARPQLSGLAIAVACYLAWVAALLLPPFRLRRGWAVGLRLSWARFREGLLAWPALVVIALGLGGIAWYWSAGGANWIGLLTAVIGMTLGGGMVWIVRVLGRVMLRREAMGFGDVTLMAMIGTYVGWQPCLLIFFLAPVFALLFGVVQLIVRKENEIYYGPFLCLAASVLIVRWTDVWQWCAPMYEMGFLVPIAMGVALVAMIVLLAMVRFFRERFFGVDEA